VLEVLENQVQLKDGKEHGIDKVASNSSHIANLSSTLPNYTYTKEGIDNFFFSNNGQQEMHSLKDSICKPLIGKQHDKPFFFYCKIHAEAENIHLESIGAHIRLKDPDTHKAKLLELLSKEKESN
jgi:hypothetical protein